MTDDVEMVITPHPSDGSKHQAVIQDTGHGRAWSGEGATAGQAATEAMRGFLGDRRAAEYVKPSK